MALDFPANPIVGQPSATYEYTDPSGSITTYVWDGEKWTAKIDGGSKVTRIIAGANITVEPPEGTGVVRINSTGGGGTPTPPPNVTQTPLISSVNNFVNEPITVTTRAIATNATFSNAVWLKDNVIIPGATSTSSYTPTEIGTYKFREIFNGDDLSVINADSNALVIGNPLQVGKGAITPNSGVEAGDTLTGSATVTNAVNPVETHVWELNGTEDQRGTSVTYTAKEGTVRYRKEVTDDNNATPVIGDWSDPVTVTAPPDPSEPTATMSGLRFDGGRATYLNRTPGVEGNRKTWTWSGWVKRSGLGAVQEIFAGGAGGADTTQFEIGFAGDDTLYCWGAVTEYLNTTQVFRDVGVWYHIVVAFDTTQATANNRLRLYVNGLEVTTFSKNNRASLTQNGDFGVNQAALHTLGRRASAASWYLNGYLSDVYFVDGKAAPPTTFAKSFEGRWGPLDSAIVKQNIDAVERQQPYDSRANTDEVWSSTASGAFFPNHEPNIYNGLVGNSPTSAYASYTQNTTATVLNGVSIPATKLRLYVNNSSNATVTVNTNAASANFVNSWGWVEVTGWTSPITSIELTDTTDASISAVEIDGRLLVDQGVWNASQNWSDTATNSDATYPVTQLFNGVNQGAGVSNAVDLKLGTITFDPPLPYTSSFGVTATGSGFNININGGGNQLVGGGSPANDGTVYPVKTGSGTISSIAGSASSGAGWLLSLVIDGAQLVDSGAQWNTSQRWSDGASGSFIPSTPATNAFDGSRDFAEPVNSDTVTFTFTPALTGTIKILSAKTLSVANGIVLNNSTNYTPSSQNPAGMVWDDITTESGGSLSSITLNKSGTVGGILAGVEVNGKVLVDGYGPGFGANGFFLPFDPAQTGANYSGSTTVSANVPQSVENIFNGDLTSVICAKGANGSTTFSVNFNGVLDDIVVTKLELAWRTSDYGSTTGEGLRFTVNNNAATKTPVSLSSNINPGRWVEVSNPPSTLSSIEAYSNFSADNSNGLMLTAIRINGKILVDHSSIGVDASGNKNNFHDQNFVTADGSNRSQVWSAGKITGVAASSSGPWTELFDGNLSTRPGPKSGNFYKIEFSPAIDTTDVTCEIYGSKGSGTGVLKINGSDYTFTNTTSQWVTIPTGNALTSLEFPSAGSADPAIIFGVRVDGQQLIDANIPVDTVRDTPMRNYVTLQSGSNGNLVGSGALTYTGESGKSYYYETNGGAVTSPAPIGNAATGIHNFGQQPFVNPRITSQDLDAGTVTLADEKFNSSQEWSTGVSASAAVYTGSPENAFDGNETSEYGLMEGNGRPRTTVTFNLTGLVQPRIKIKNPVSASNFVVTTNDGPQSIPTFSSLTWYSLPASTTSIVKTEATGGAGQQVVSISAIESNGKLLVDSSVYNTWNTSQNWSDNITTNSSQPVTRLTNGDVRTSYSSGTDMDNNAVLLDRTAGYIRLDAEIDVENTISVLSGEWNSGGNEENYVVKVGNSGLGEFISTTANRTQAVWTDFTYTGKIENTNILEINASNSVKDGEPRILAIRVDGEVLVDSGAGTFNTLYQTWSQWARTTLGYALDRIAKLEQQRASDVETIAALRTDVQNALARISSIESDEINDDAVDTSLLALVADLRERVEALEAL